MKKILINVVGVLRFGVTEPLSCITFGQRLVEDLVAAQPGVFASLLQTRDQDE